VESEKRKKGFVRRLAGWGLRLGVLVFVFLTGAFLAAFALPIYHHFWLYPRQAAAWKELAAQRQPVALQTGYTEYRGVMHSHSEISHDSEVTFPEIAAALHKADCQFIFLTDHVVEGKADYSLGWRGVHDGILFVQGYEMHDGFMPWGLPPGTVLDNGANPAEQARQIRELGGVLAFGHVEAGRPFEIPEVDAMEIYNIHTDMLDEMIDAGSRMEAAKEMLLNLYGHGDQTLRRMFDWWILSMLIQKWDEQSEHRKITAIAANDCHQNVGIRGLITEQNTLLLLDTGHNDPLKKVAEFALNPATRLLLRACFGELTPGRQLFRIDGDPYERTARFVNTHLLAKELSEPALIDALRQGRAFVAFNMLADASGFAFVARSGGLQATMGDQIVLAPDLKLLAETPLPCLFTLFRNGKKVAESEGKTFEYAVTAPGKYRIQAFLSVPGEMCVTGESFHKDMAPWIIANPIEVVP